MDELEGILRLLLGASVQVRREGGTEWSLDRRREPSVYQLWSSCLPQCEHRELFIRHIRGLSLDVQSELAAVIQEVLMQSRSDTV